MVAADNSIGGAGGHVVKLSWAAGAGHALQLQSRARGRPTCAYACTY